jgi:thiol-disulfide isomerase/thioredoxin
MRMILALLFLMSAALSAAEKVQPFHRPLLEFAPQLIDASGAKVDARYLLKTKYIILYFSASWCGPCHKYTPKLVEWYEKERDPKQVEVILVGSDQDTASMKAYMKDMKMPWPAFEMKGKAFEDIKKKYSGRGIPSTVLLNEQDEVLASSYKDGKYQGPHVAIDALRDLLGAEPK